MLLILLAACAETSAQLGAPGQDTGTIALADSAPASLWCLNFESGTLGSVGYEGDTSVAQGGGDVFIATEGADFSPYGGEEALDLPGTSSLGLRAAMRQSAEVRSPVFTVNAEVLSWWQLSEWDSTAVGLSVQLLGANGELLAEALTPVRTSGYLPELDDVSAKGNDLDQAPPAPGTWQQLDLAPWMGEQVSLRLVQTNLLEGYTFFTLLDEICHGAPVEGAEQVSLQTLY